MPRYSGRVSNAGSKNAEELYILAQWVATVIPRRPMDCNLASPRADRRRCEAILVQELDARIAHSLAELLKIQIAIGKSGLCAHQTNHQTHMLSVFVEFMALSQSEVACYSHQIVKHEEPRMRYGLYSQIVEVKDTS